MRYLTLVPITLAAEAVITSIASDGLQMDVEVPAGYPLNDWASASTKKTVFSTSPARPVLEQMQDPRGTNSFGCNVYVGSSRFLRVGAGDMYVQRIEALGPSRAFRLSFSHDVGPRAQAVAEGDTLGCRNAAFAFTVHIDGCSDSRFERLTLKGGPGFGFFHSHPRGGSEDANRGANTFSRLLLTYPDPPAGASAQPVLSASADAFHINGLPIGPTIEHSTFEGHNDDGLAIHGSYSLIVQVDGDVLAGVGGGGGGGSGGGGGGIGGGGGDNGSGSSGGDSGNGTVSVVVTDADFMPGHALTLYDTAFRRASAVRLAAITRLPGYSPPHNTSATMPSVLARAHSFLRLTLVAVEPVPPLRTIGVDWVVFNTDRGCSHFSLLNNTIRNHRARGMLIKASNGKVHGNHIENSSLGGIILTPELSWGEGDYVTNVSVMRNLVRNVCIGLQCYGGIALGAVDSSHRFASGPYGHQDIWLVGNAIENVSQLNILITSANRVVVANNSVTSPYSYAPVATCCPPLPFPANQLALITEASGVDVAGNCVREPGSHAPTIWLNVTASVVDSHDAGGFYKC